MQQRKQIENINDRRETLTNLNEPFGLYLVSEWFAGDYALLNVATAVH